MATVAGLASMLAWRCRPASSRAPSGAATSGAELGAPPASASPRSAQGTWEPGPDRVDPLQILAEQDRTRVPELVPVRYGRMLASAFTFYRGAAAIMAADLAAGPDSGLRVQLCGDAHLSNFGVFQAPDRRLVFDINDFDETLPGPFEWDVKRLAASVAIGARDRGFKRRRGRGRGARRGRRLPQGDGRVRGDERARRLVRAPRRRRVRARWSAQSEQGGPRAGSTRTSPRPATRTACGRWRS